MNSRITRKPVETELRVAAAFVAFAFHGARSLVDELVCSAGASTEGEDSLSRYGGYGATPGFELVWDAARSGEKWRYSLGRATGDVISHSPTRPPSGWHQ